MLVRIGIGCFVDFVRCHDKGSGIDHEDVGRAPGGCSDLGLGSNVGEGSTVLERGRRQLAAVPPVGHGNEVWTLSTRRCEPEVAAPTKTLQRGLAPSTRRPSRSVTAHPPILAFAGG